MLIKKPTRRYTLMCKIEKKRNVQNAKARIALLCDTIREHEVEIIEMELEVKSLREFVAGNSEK